jgi:hypothetical protein
LFELAMLVYFRSFKPEYTHIAKNDAKKKMTALVIVRKNILASLNVIIGVRDTKKSLKRFPAYLCN